MTGPVTHRDEPGGWFFWACTALGWIAIVAAALWLRDQPLAHTPDLARFLVATLFAHDAVLAPFTMVAGLLLVRIVPVSVRAVVQGGLIVSAALVLFAFPFVRGYGRHPDNPSALPGNYATGLLTALGAVWLVAGGLALWRLLTRSTDHRGAPRS